MTSDLYQTETLLLIGAPASETLSEILADPVKKVILVEPDPDRAAVIAAKLKHRDHVEIISAAIYPKEVEAQLHRYNEPSLHGLRTPTPHLRKLYPGLRVISSLTVQTITAGQLLDQIALPNSRLALWLDAQGEEWYILQSLAGKGVLNTITRITLRCGAEPSFDGTRSAKDLAEYLVAKGFVLEHQDDSDPDWPRQHFARPASYWVLCAADPRNTDATKAGTKDHQEEALRFLLQKMTTLQEQYDQALQDLAEARRAASLWEQERGVLTQRAEEAQRNLANAERMNTLVRSDLHELRGRYMSVEAERTQQTTLLRKLAPRLQHAMAGIKELTVAEDEISPPPSAPRASGAKHDKQPANQRKAAPRNNAAKQSPQGTPEDQT